MEHCIHMNPTLPSLMAFVCNCAQVLAAYPYSSLLLTGRLSAAMPGFQCQQPDIFSICLIQANLFNWI